MARRGLSASDQPQQIKPKQAGGTLDFSLPNVATIGASVLAADMTKATLNAIFDVQPTNREVMDQLKRVEQMLLSLKHEQAMTRIDVGHTHGLVSDVMQGVGATGDKAHHAIVASQKRRGLKAPKAPQPPQLPKPEPGR